MPLTLVFSTRARKDLRSILVYIASDNPKAATLFIDKIEQKCRDIIHAPQAYPLVPEFGANIRKLVYHNYLILYTHSESSVLIVHVMHRARKAKRIIPL